MSEKKLICTIAHGESYEMLASASHPAMKDYAARCGADFESFPVNAPLPEGLSPAWLKLIGIHKRLEKYDRVCFIDTDLIIHPEAPNLFDVVPPEKFGAFFEGLFIAQRFYSLEQALKDYAITTKRKYQGEYFNSGVMVLSKLHRDIFIWPESQHSNFYEQGLLNARVFASEIPVHRLNYKFNRMNFYDKLIGEDRRASWFVHYAGQPDKERVKGDMLECLRFWKAKETPLTYIHLALGGGFGDVAVCEPIIRFMMEKWYAHEPNTRVVLTTSYPRIFQHIKYANLQIAGTEDVLDKNIVYCQKRGHPDEAHWTRGAFPYHEIHNQDLASYSLMSGLLPAHKRTIKIEIEQKDRNELAEKLGRPLSTLGNAVAIHAGTGWPSKTFPIDWWQAIVDGLAAAGMLVILFGKEKIFSEYKKGFLPLTCPPSGIDLRNKLENAETTGALYALFEACPKMLSNDSSPIHLAGAFDNWIFLISTTKRAEFLFPYRHGRNNYKCVALQNKLTSDALGFKPNCPDEIRISEVVGDIRDYLPTPEYVVKIVSETH